MQVFFQSAVIPYRIQNKQPEILLITSINKQKWIIPKGIIEEGETPEESAQKEAIEEAGDEGTVSQNIWGEYQQEKWGGICQIKVYSLQVTKISEDWLESDLRKRKWFTPNEVLEVIENNELRDVVRKFINDSFK